MMENEMAKFEKPPMVRKSSWAYPKWRRSCSSSLLRSSPSGFGRVCTASPSHSDRGRLSFGLGTRNPTLLRNLLAEPSADLRVPPDTGSPYPQPWSRADSADDSHPPLPSEP